MESNISRGTRWWRKKYHAEDPEFRIKERARLREYKKARLQDPEYRARWNADVARRARERYHDPATSDGYKAYKRAWQAKKRQAATVKTKSASVEPCV